MSLHTLSCKAQNYAWGKIGQNSLVAQLLTSSNTTATAVDAEKPYAELWMGTHPSAPATCPSDENKTFRDVLQSSGQKNIPYLFKVLSINKALSIQAHPDKKLAEQLHAKDPAHYPDDNHKPELVVALTPFEALCCFRTLDQLQWFATHIPEFASAAPECAAKLRSVSSSSDAEGGSDAHHDKRSILQPILSSLYNVGAEETGKFQRDFLSRLQEWKKSSSFSSSVPAFAKRAIAAFEQVYSQFPDDVGCWMVFVLNVVDLKPGDGLFLAANEPHAYLSGDCVEIMAASDNVIRAGLTPKFKDVQILVDALTYRTDSLQAAAFHSQPNLPVQSYCPPSFIPEFRLERLTVKDKTQQEGLSIVVKDSAAIFLVIEGQGVANVNNNNTSEGKNGKEIRRGDIQAVIPSSSSSEQNTVLNIKNTGESPLTIFIAQARGNGESIAVSNSRL